MNKETIPTNELAEPLHNLIEDARELLSATAGVAGDKVTEARRRLSAALEKGRETWRTVQSSAVSGARATDHAIRENPYKSIGIAFGLGVVLGLVLRRRE